MSTVEAQSATTTSSTVPAPTSVQTTYLYRHGHTFAGQIDVFVPGGPTQTIVVQLWLSQSAGPFSCTATPRITPSTTPASAATPGPIGAVEAENVTCLAATLPTVYAPVLEVQIPAATALFLPVMLRDDSNDFRIAAWPSGFGALAALLAVAFSYLVGSRRRRIRRPSDGPWVRPGDRVGADAAWTASDSWVTNLTTIGGILGTVLGGSGMLATVFVGVPIERFEVMLLLFGALAAFGPLVYGLCSYQPRATRDVAAAKTQGRVVGVLVASVFTLTAAFGEVIAVGLLVHLATAGASERYILYFGLLATAGIVAWYSVRSIGNLLETAAKESPVRPLSSLTHSGLISATL